jgi:hypothetical protein
VISAPTTGKRSARSRHRTTPAVADITSPTKGIGQLARDYAAAFSS